MGYFIVFAFVALCFMAYVIMGFIQLNAILAWMRLAGWPNWAAHLGSWCLAFLPGIGSAVAAWAACIAWNWSPLKAMLVFFWFPVFYLAMSLSG